MRTRGAGAQSYLGVVKLNVICQNLQRGHIYRTALAPIQKVTQIRVDGCSGNGLCGCQGKVCALAHLCHERLENSDCLSHREARSRDQRCSAALRRDAQTWQDQRLPLGKDACAWRAVAAVLLAGTIGQ